ncbi:GAF domain-containing protein [bacterium]|nr:GAF domain-containing protein [bacterium]MBU1072226.1 GAF domain-containing protein [bacterium]MBU1676675.1 GAF domain-containing protein [bacterium]
MNRYAELLEEVRGILGRENRAEDKMQGVASLLHDNVEGFDCVAFFLLEPDHRRQLLLGPQAGEGIDPGSLVVGQGICGQVAEHGISIVVDDVTEELNYVTGHPNTRSEMVLPIYRSGQVEAELDINSFRLARFGSDDRMFLEEVCLLLTDQV